MSANTSELQELRRRHDAYMAAWKLHGRPSLSYVTPCCGQALETTAPSDPRDVWDSLCTCPCCGELYFKWVWPERVEAVVLPKEAIDFQEDFSCNS